jgi:hypothetical protein
VDLDDAEGTLGRASGGIFGGAPLPSKRVPTAQAAALVIAFAYFVFWLSAGAGMLWEWHHCACLSAARVCVRCAHIAASHRAPASCAVRLGSLNIVEMLPVCGLCPAGRRGYHHRPAQTAWQPPDRVQRSLPGPDAHPLLTELSARPHMPRAGSSAGPGVRLGYARVVSRQP